MEQIDNPSLKGKPVIVGALPGRRGVVSACSYEARKFGIKSAMPISQAYRLCPEGIYLPVRMSRYIEVSQRVMEILKSFSPVFQRISVDEAFIDATGTERLFGSPESLARKIKKRVREETKLTVSIGIAPNRYLAKLASDFSKPDGLYIIRPGEEEAFIDKVELKDLWGVGKKTLAKLKELNITSTKKLRSFPKEMLASVIGKSAADYLYMAVRGIDPGIHPPQTRSHSISSEVTFQTDRKDLPGIKRVLLELSEELMYRLLKEKKHSRTIVLKLRYSDFTTVTIQKSLKHPVSSSDELFQIAGELLKKKWKGNREIRLIGLGLANVTEREDAEQKDLFEDSMNRKRKVEETIALIKEKISDVEITKASLLKRKTRHHHYKDQY